MDPVGPNHDVALSLGLIAIGIGVWLGVAVHRWATDAQRVRRARARAVRVARLRELGYGPVKARRLAGRY